jgi:hypothetical protein
MVASSAEIKAVTAIMPKLLSPIFTGLFSRSAKTAKTSYGNGKADSLPKCHNTLGYGIGSQTGILTLAKHVARAAIGILEFLKRILPR